MLLATIQGEKKRKAYEKIGSTDITHAVIKPQGEWYGMGSNYDYSNVKPQQPILPYTQPVVKKTNSDKTNKVKPQNQKSTTKTNNNLKCLSRLIVVSIVRKSDNSHKN